MSIDINKKSEGVDYEIIPSHEHEDAWSIRITKGNFIETVIQYGAIRFNEIPKNMSFNFFVVSSPLEDLTSEDEDLQKEAAEILEDVIANGINSGSVIMKDLNANKS